MYDEVCEEKAMHGRRNALYEIEAIALAKICYDFAWLHLVVLAILSNSVFSKYNCTSESQSLSFFF